MIKQLLTAGFLATGLLACAPNQTTSNGQRGREILRPGQIWQVRGTTVSGQTDQFSMTLAKQPGFDEKGGLGYEDQSGIQLVNGFQSQVGIYYDPVDADPEFMNAGWIRTNPTTKERIERLCFAWIAPEQTNFDQFQGRYAMSNRELSVYVLKKDTSTTGTCTITLQK